MKKLYLQDIFFFVILISITVGFFKVITPYLISLCIAMILAHVFHNPYKWLMKKRIKGRYAALIIVVLILIIIVLPVIFGSMVLVKQTNDVFVQNWDVVKNEVQIVIDKIVSYFPGNQFLLADGGVGDLGAKIVSVLDSFFSFFVVLLQRAVVSISAMILQFIVILYIVFFFLLQGKEFIKKIHYTIPLNDKDEAELFKGLSRIVSATIMGSILIGALEGIYGGFLFWALGIEGALIWGMVMAILSMIPIVGTNTILLPAAIGFIVQGNWIGGLIILIFGSMGILISQNIIRPRLVGHHSGLHPALIVISTLGGITWLGLIGFIIGPLIASLFVLIWEQFTKRYNQEIIEGNG